MSKPAVEEMRQYLIRATKASCPLVKQGQKCSAMHCVIGLYYAGDTEITAKYAELVKQKGADDE